MPWHGYNRRLKDAIQRYTNRARLSAKRQITAPAKSPDRSMAAETKTETNQGTRDPHEWFADWMREANASGEDLPHAMTLATVSADGRPSARMVLLQGFEKGGYVFYTNLESRKAENLAGNPHAALCFHWKILKRQVRIEGIVEAVTDEEADEYFQTRPKGSQIGAWASKQSAVLESRFALEKAVAKYAARFNIGKIVRPDFWSGYRLMPDHMEFWQDRVSRLHDRDAFTRETPTSDTPWRHDRLYP